MVIINKSTTLNTTQSNNKIENLNNINNNYNTQKTTNLEPPTLPASNLTKKNSFTDRANKLIKQFEILNNKLDSSNKSDTNSSIKKEDLDDLGVISADLSKEIDENTSKFINSLLLPSKYIDLSLFFYSPSNNQSRQEQELKLLNNLYELSSNQLLQTSTDSSILTSSTLSNTSSNTSSSFSNTSSSLNHLNNSDTVMMMSVANYNHHHQNLNNNFNNSTNSNLTIQSNNNSNNSSGNNINNNSSSDEHEELIAEMEIIERLPTQERLKQAKRRRALQLKKWTEFDNQFATNMNRIKIDYETNLVNNSTISNNTFTNTSRTNRSIKFQNHIVLLDAIMRKDYDEVERLLQTGITANSANEDGLTAIHQCCIDDSADLLKLLIKYGADVNVCDNDLWTPLHAAATCANLEICKILIENNADLLAVNTDGNMPYDICEDEVCLEYIESEMASRGVTQQTIDLKRSESEFKMLEDLKMLCLDQIHQLQNDQNLTSSIRQRKDDLLKHNNFFLYFNEPITDNLKIDLNAKDTNGASLLHIASANGYNSVIEFLLNDCPKLVEDSNAPLLLPSLSIKDNDGWTPLHVATFWGHQRAIEILLEHGADINIKTKNDETVLDLCDDPDVREFIIQKSKEIESEQQKQAAARAAAAMQAKLQMISSSNNSLNNGSIKNSTTNSSTRSLKRTSTGVSRSSSVRRSSFREKEKAARKLDTSFKDFLYATEAQENQSSEVSKSALHEENEISDESFNNEKFKPKIELPINPIIINHKDQSDNSNQTQQQNKKVTSVVKIINNSTTILSSSNTTKLPHNTEPPSINIYEASPQVQKSFMDDFNNNQLRLNNEQLNNNNSTLTQVTQIARIHSNGNYAPQVNPQTFGSSSSYSLSSSLTIPVNTNTNNNNNNQNNTLNNTSSLSQNENNLTINSNLTQKTVSGSSIAIIDVNNSNLTKKELINQQQVKPIHVKLNQPKAHTVNDIKPSIEDGVKYKFISNQTIGGKGNTEFDDINVQQPGHKKLKCLKCCNVM